ncbi:hypothetical protein JOM56_004367 [Amanita muscaria]
MSSPVTWYRITNVVVALGLAVAKYTVHDAKVSTLDFAGAVFTGIVLYVIGWWENDLRLQWYFKTDWEAQRQGMNSIWTSCVDGLEHCRITLGSLIHEDTIRYACLLFCSNVL